MTAPLYDVIQGLALDIANASAADNDLAGSEAYDALKDLCQSQQETDLDHPLQWEALGDFSENHDEAHIAYQKGLRSAIKLDLPEYSASIKFAMAEIYLEQQNLPEAQRLATEASVEVEHTNNNELKVVINEFLNDVRHT